MEWSHKSLRVFGHFLSKSAILVRAGQFWQVRTRPKKCEHQFVLLLGGHTLSVPLHGGEIFLILSLKLYSCTCKK